MSYLEQAIEQARALGGPVAEAYRPVLGWRARAEALNAELDAIRAAGESNHAGLVRALAEGKLELAEVATRAGNPWVYDSAASKVVVAAVAACHAQVDTSARAAAGTVFAALQKMCAAVVDESVRLVASLPGDVTDNEAAFRHGPEHFGSWMRCAELVEQWVRVHRLAETLRSAGWVPGPEHRHKSALRPAWWTKFAFPDRLPPGWTEQPEPLKLGLAKAAEPGLYDWTDAAERLAERDRRMGRTDVHAMNEITVHRNAFEAGAYMQVAANTPVARPAPVG